MSKARWALVVAIALAVAAAAALDLGRFLSLDTLKQTQATLQAWHARDPLTAAAVFVAVYVSATALSLPGAVVLTLAGGALFGLLWGTVLVSFAATLGAVLAFLSARFLLRGAVQRRFGKRLKAIDAGLARDGAMYLLTLRLVPVIPFFVINLALGLTALRTRTFYAVSQLGMLPGTLVYVNAGTRLGELRSAGDVLNPALIGSFALLAVFPWIGRAIAGRLRTRKLQAPWRAQRPRRYERNLVVIGAGAAGLVAAYVASALKASVTLVEAHRMGGDCLNYGCVPSKALIQSARLAHRMRHADAYGIAAVQPEVRFGDVMRRVREVVTAVEPHDSVERYTALGVDVVLGRARIVDPWTVEITQADGTVRRLTTRAIVIAAGARPAVPDLPGLADVGCVTSDTLWDALATLDEVPQRMLVLGGGPIGCELAQAFARLGSAVTQVEQGQSLLKREDDEVAAIALQALRDDGVQVLLGHTALRCERDGTDKVLVARGANGEVRIGFDLLLCAVGREARLEGYGLEELGIPIGRTVETDEYLQTLHPNIYAAGDVAGPYQFTHAASHQGWHAAVNALFGSLHRFRVDYRFMPAATFVDPEIARVGLNEREAAAQGVAVEVTRYGLDDLDRAIADGRGRGFVKVLTVPGKDRILGVTIVGEHAAELLAEMALAMRHGLGLGKVLSTIHAYPTWAEANKAAAGQWRRAHQPAAVMRWLGRYHAWRRA